MKDYLIVGQGLAGSLLARELLQRGLDTEVVDPGSAVSASLVAAGIFNPITGKRCVRTWGDTWLLPFAEQYYTRFGKECGLPMRFPLPVLRIFRNLAEREAFEQRAADSVYSGYIERRWSGGEILPGVQAPHGGVTFNGGGFVDIARVLAACREELERRGALFTEPLAYDDLCLHGGHVEWRGRSYRNVVFCEGHRVSSNPWFQAIPFRHAKGEVLTVEIPGLSEKQLLTHGVFALPVGSGRFRLGATYEWSDLDERPSESGRAKLVDAFSAFCSLPVQVVAHHAAVRPIAVNRAPVAGRHPEHRPLALLNGFGSKGVLYAPYYSRMLADHLEQGTPIDEKVSIAAHWKPS